MTGPRLQPVWRAIHHIAYVDVRGQGVRNEMPFAETVAANRGVQVRIFADVPAAESWLTAQIVAIRNPAGAPA